MAEPLTATVGWSDHPDAGSAGKEAAEQAVKQLTSSHPRLAIVFGSSWYHQATLLQGIRRVLGQVPTVGESTAGEIVARGPVSRSCAVLLLAADSPMCSVGMGQRVDQAPRDAGQRAASIALREFPGGPRAGFLLFGDGLAMSSGEVVRGIQESLGTSALIVGGLAGDDFRFTRTYQYLNDRVVSRAVVGVLLGEPVRLGVGIEHGFAPISKPRRITRASANILYELDRHPAASVYEEYLGADMVQRMRREGVARHGIAYPLGVHPETTNQWLLRNVVSFGDDGSLSCSGEIPEGCWLQLMIGNKELALDAAQHAARQAVQSLNHVGAILVFDSATRRKLLGSDYAAKEIATIRAVIGTSTPLVGCYTYGEQAPVGTDALERTATQTGSVLIVALGT